MKIRKATKKDFESIAKLINKEYLKLPYNEPWEKKNAVRTLVYFSKIGSIHVLANNKEIIGFIIFRIENYNDRDAIMIEELIIDSDFQGKGFGRKLVRFVEDYAKHKKIKKVWLIASRDAPAYNFYEKIGYKLCKRIVMFDKEIK
jgi:aminoglycoside 6'-N-acetyltransferase I